MLESEYIADCCGMEEMAKFVGCGLGKPKDRYDLVILGDSQPLCASEAISGLGEYLQKSSGVLVLIDKYGKEEVESKFPPRRILKAQMCPNFLLQHHGHHYFFVY